MEDLSILDLAEPAGVPSIGLIPWFARGSWKNSALQPSLRNKAGLTFSKIDPRLFVRQQARERLWLHFSHVLTVLSAKRSVGNCRTLRKFSTFLP